MTHSQPDEPPPRRRFLAIVNPISGRRDVSGKIDRVAKCLSEHGAQLVIERTRAPGHAAELAREAPPETDAILIVGGDGTVNEVLAGLNAARTPLAIFPTGTENLIAKYRRMPRRPDQIARMLLCGPPENADLGLANGKVFAAVVGVGFDAECVQRLSARRCGHISYWSYVTPILQTFLQHRFPPLRVTVDDATVFEGRGLAIAGIIPRYAAGLRVLKFADPTDGLLDVVVFECASRTRLLRHALNVALRRHAKHAYPESLRCAAGVTYAQGSRISISSTKAVLVEVDGDLAETLPLEIVVKPRAARFVRPVV